MAVAICPKCGARNLPSLDYCGSCGADLGDVVVTESTVTDPYERILEARRADGSARQVEGSENRVKSRNLRENQILSIVAGPLTLISFIVLLASEMWKRSIGPVYTSSGINQNNIESLQHAADLWTISFYAFCLLVMVDLYLLAGSRR